MRDFLWCSFCLVVRVPSSASLQFVAGGEVSPSRTSPLPLKDSCGINNISSKLWNQRKKKIYREWHHQQKQHQMLFMASSSQINIWFFINLLTSSFYRQDWWLQIQMHVNKLHIPFDQNVWCLSSFSLRFQTTLWTPRGLVGHHRQNPTAQV